MQLFCRAVFAPREGVDVRAVAAGFRRLILWLGLGLCLLFGSGAGAATSDSLVWQTASNRVSADLHGEALWPLLEDIAHQTGWHIFVEPGASRKADVKFKNLESGEALKKLLGDLNFAFVPQTNEADHLYVFTTTMHNATQRVGAALAKRSPAKHVPNELLVKLKPGVDIDAIAKALGAKVIDRDDKSGIYRLQFADEAAMEAALTKLKANSDVEAVEYNNYFDPPLAPQQITPNANTPGAVSLTLDSSKNNSDPCNPIVGLVDTGIQSLGSELDQFIMKPISVAGDSTSTTTGASTVPTHATSMAQTILRAIAQQTTKTSVKILPVDVYGSNEMATTGDVAKGIKAAVDGGATVVNLSLGGTMDSAILDSIIQQALAKGVVFYAAAGNVPVNTPTFPAAIGGVNAVTALGAPGQLASYANFGSFVDMALPGNSVVILGGNAWVVQGTSPATAYASGVAAGYKTINCDSWAQIQSMMQQRFPVPTK